MTEAAFLLDSNICIYVLADAQCRAARRLGACEPGSVVTSAIVYAEVLRGIVDHGAAAIDQYNRFFRRIPVVPFDQSAAYVYHSIPFKRGKFDRLIAGHALSLGLTLVTNNTEDFADVPGLRIENWTL